MNSYTDELANALRESYRNTSGYEEIAREMILRLQDKGFFLVRSRKAKFKVGDVVYYIQGGDRIEREIVEVYPNNNYLWKYPDSDSSDNLFYSGNSCDPKLELFKKVEK